MAIRKQSRKRRTNEELFVARLAELTNDDKPLTTNVSLRTKLKWDEEKYNETKKKLRKDGKIVVGLGFGGRIGLADAVRDHKGKALKLFVSYSHADERYKVDLLKHLEPLRRQGYIETWHDGKITAGKELDKAIKSELNSADIILLLISIDYINSYYCVEVEMRAAIARHNAGGSRVIPVIVRNCMWKGMDFSNHKALPTDGKAVVSWANSDEALVSVAEGVELAAKELLDKG